MMFNFVLHSSTFFQYDICSLGEPLVEHLGYRRIDQFHVDTARSSNRCFESLRIKVKWQSLLFKIVSQKMK